ncbi:hypothetical protein N7507_009540 [Penicillium longicatenatum]|nr:hypothetical protein N7507_009540 [Penicillium longicatenatum]
MILVPQFALMLATSGFFASAYQLTACTDTKCSENCKVITNDDVSSTSSCNDFGFNVKSIEWYDTLNTFNGWKSAGCSGGPGDENVWITCGNTKGECYDITESDLGKDGIQYWEVNSSGE